jgi:HPt (histidine-containing phosphotransfer) domain-containing protein
MIDKSIAMRVFQIDERQYDELLEEFVVQADEKIAVIETNVRERNLKEAVAAAHSLKGVAGNLRLDDCYAVAQRIEAALKGNDLAALESIASDFKKAVTEIRAALSH